MRSCNHEEADTRILVHVKDALAKGGRSVLVRTVETDVLVILIAQFHTLSSTWPGLSCWVAFGMGKNFHLLSVNTICEYLKKMNEMPCASIFSRVYGMRYYVSIPREGKEICVGGLESHRGFPFRER